jgi:CubicO group peptidase (beta-lactamase class C family)
VITAYSNYGAGLAGYIVSRVSGEPYDQYVQRHLLDPLDMRHSTATEPVPAALASDLARSYNTDDGAAETVPFTFDRMPPDGSISTTATDMARFAATHLGHGPAVLGPATMATMHERSYGVDPRSAATPTVPGRDPQRAPGADARRRLGGLPEAG